MLSLDEKIYAIKKLKRRFVFSMLIALTLFMGSFVMTLISIKYVGENAFLGLLAIVVGYYRFLYAYTSKKPKQMESEFYVDYLLAIAISGMGLVIYTSETCTLHLFYACFFPAVSMTIMTVSYLINGYASKTKILLMTMLASYRQHLKELKVTDKESNREQL